MIFPVKETVYEYIISTIFEGWKISCKYLINDFVVMNCTCSLKNQFSSEDKQLLLIANLYFLLINMPIIFNQDILPAGTKALELL